VTPKPIETDSAHQAKLDRYAAILAAGRRPMGRPSVPMEQAARVLRARRVFQAARDAQVKAAASALPFLPRVEAGPVILAPARWRIDPATGLSPHEPDFAGRLGRWREAWQVPHRVYLAESDNRLLLDLDWPSHVAQLEAAIRRRPDGVLVQEPLPDLDDAWLPGPDGKHICELVGR
jgi:hypothetical protein